MIIEGGQWCDPVPHTGEVPEWLVALEWNDGERP